MAALVKELNMSNTQEPPVATGLADRMPGWLFPRLSGLHMVALFIALLLIGLLLVPVAQVVYVAFQNPATGALTLQNFVDFFNTSLFRKASGTRFTFRPCRWWWRR